MRLSDARSLARTTANECNKTTYVYLDTLKAPDKDFDVAFSIPSFGVQEGDPFEPAPKVYVPEQIITLGNTIAGSSNKLKASAKE